MKPPRPDLQNVRIIRLATQILSLPFVFLAALCRLPGRLQLKSEKDLRAEDQIRQSRVRRQLRGLPADHLPEPPAAR
jgi:hypothetical protein